jgi:hypothetical protein
MSARCLRSREAIINFLWFGLITVNVGFALGIVDFC